MILREFIRVVNLNWEQVAWGSLWAALIIVIFNTLLLMSVIPFTYNYIMRKILPKLYNGKVRILQESNKILKAENVKLKFQNQALIDDKRLIKKALGV